MITNNRIPKSVLILLSLFLFNFIWGAKAPSSKKELETLATHIVVGKVQAVYSYKDREGIRLVSGYEYDHKVAEVKVEKVEKGKISESLVYVRYWSRTWKGIGLPPPGGQSYENQPKKDQTCRFYLARNAYDGWSRQGNNDGGYNVVYVNGIQPIDK
tara:strand:+ start:224 stop:694 length:471 start_codon:yes stop_codon:yes gene_type:complete